MARQRSVFDVVGPIMIGPSSSHTAGAVRLGALAASILGVPPSRARIGLHGSFASTGRGHGTDLALVAGLLGMRPDDIRIPRSFDHARERGLEFSFRTVDLGEVHPNSAVFELEGAERSVAVSGSSLGGGDVAVWRIDGFDVEIDGELPVLLVDHQDRLGEIAAVTGLLAESEVNIARMHVSRESRGARALMLIETDADVPEETRLRVEGLPGVFSVRCVQAV